MPKKRKSTVNDAISNLTEALEQREKELDEREQKLREDEERFRAERSVAYGETAPSDVLHLNVGGTKTTVLRRTLTAIPGSMLATKFSGRWDDSIEKDEDGHFFIDQDFSLFNIILKCLRNRANGDDKIPFKSPILPENQFEDRFDLFRMVEYYGMTDTLYPTKLMRFRGRHSLKIDSPRTVVTKSFATLSLSLDGHDRPIKTYEVTLGEVQRFQMGWASSDATRNYFDNPDEESYGIGEFYGSFGLDFTRSSFLAKRHVHNRYRGNSNSDEGIRMTVNGLEVSAGTVLLSKNYGRQWYVNGKLVFDAKNQICGFTKTYPLIGVQGKIEVTSVELDNNTNSY